jgi:hypothetical protein
MTGLVRKATLLGVCGLLYAATALANVPSPANSTCCRWIFVGGFTSTAGTTADPSIRCCITVRDFANNPIPGSNIEINFQNCCDLALCSAVVAGQTVDCAGDAVRGTSNGSGQFCFSIIGGSYLSSCTPPQIFSGPDSNCVRIFADGVELCRATAVIYDLNANSGGNGVNGADLGFLKNDVGAAGLGAKYRGRADYNCSGSVNGADIGFYKTILGNSGLGNGSAGGCSSGGGPAAYCAHPVCPVGPCKSP